MPFDPNTAKPVKSGFNPATARPVQASARSQGQPVAPPFTPRTFFGDLGEGLMKAAADPYDWRTGGPLNAMNLFKSAGDAVGAVTHAAGGMLGRANYDRLQQPHAYSNNILQKPFVHGTRAQSEQSTEMLLNMGSAFIPVGAEGQTAKVVGEGASMAEKLASGPLRPVVRVANKAMGGKLLDPMFQAKQSLAAAIAKDGGTPEQIAAIVNEWHGTGASNPALLDAVSKLPNGGQNTLGLVRGSAMTGSARGVATKYRQGVEANLQDNAQNLTQGLHPDTRTTEQLIADTKAQRAANAQNLYGDIYNTPVDLKKETLAALSDAPGNAALLKSRASAVANQRWDQVAEIDNLLKSQDQNFNWTFREPGAAPISDSGASHLRAQDFPGYRPETPNPPWKTVPVVREKPPSPLRNTYTGQPPVKTAPNLPKPTGVARAMPQVGPAPSTAYVRLPELPAPPRVSGGTLDRARIHMREAAKEAFKTGANDMGRGLSGRVDQIDSTLADVPAFQPARADYGNLSAQAEAAQHGSDNILTQLPSQFDAELARVNQAVRPVGDVPVDTGLQSTQNALQIGARNRIVGEIGQPAAGSSGLLNRLSTGNNMTAKLGTVFGDAAPRYQAGIGNEVARVQNARSIDANTGSQTAGRVADSALVDHLETAINIKTGGLMAILKKLKEGLTLTDAEREAVVQLATRRADMSALQPMTQTLTTPARGGMHMPPPLQMPQLGGPPTIPPLIPNGAMAGPPQKDRRK